jgi:hypothetical protein
MTEVISRALAVYEALVAEQAKESEIVIRKKDGKEMGLMLVPA